MLQELLQIESGLAWNGDAIEKYGMRILESD